MADQNLLEFHPTRTEPSENSDDENIYQVYTDSNQKTTVKSALLRNASLRKKKKLLPSKSEADIMGSDELAILKKLIKFILVSNMDAILKFKESENLQVVKNFAYILMAYACERDAKQVYEALNQNFYEFFDLEQKNLFRRVTSKDIDPYQKVEARQRVYNRALQQSFRYLDSQMVLDVLSLGSDNFMILAVSPEDLHNLCWRLRFEILEYLFQFKVFMSIDEDYRLKNDEQSNDFYLDQRMSQGYVSYQKQIKEVQSQLKVSDLVEVVIRYKEREGAYSKEEVIMMLILQFQLQIDHYQTLCLLYAYKYKALLFEIIVYDELKNKDEFIFNALKITFEIFDFESCVRLHKFFNISSIKNGAKYPTEILKSMKTSKTFYEYKVFFFNLFFQYANMDHCFMFLELIEKDISSPSKESFVVVNSNPLKILMMILQSLYFIQSKYHYTSLRCKQLREKIESLSSQIVNQISSLEELEIWLMSEDLNEKNVLWYIQYCDVKAILECQVMDQLMRKYWDGKYDLTGTMFDVSQAYRVFMGYQSDRMQLIESPNENYGSNLFQFQSWQQSGYLRYTIEVLVYLTTAIYAQYTISLFLESLNSIIQLYQYILSLSTLPPEFEQIMEALQDSLANESGIASATLQAGFYIFIVSCTFMIKRFNQLIFKKKTKRYQFAYQVDVFVDFGIFICVAIWLASSYYYEHKPPPTGITFDTQQENFTFNVAFAIATGSGIRFDVLLSFTSFFLWFKFFLFFQMTRFLGFLIRLVFDMLLEILKFLCLWFLTVFIFACFGTLIFKQIEEFQTLANALFYLFLCSLGGYDFSIFDDDPETSKAFGYLYQIIYIIIGDLILFSLLGALFFNVYAQVMKTKNGLFNFNVLVEMQNYYYSPLYFSLVAATPPFNLFVIPFTPFFIFSKSYKFLYRLNQVLMVWAYLPIWLVMTVFFLVFAIVIAPFNYVMQMYRSFVAMFLPTEKRARAVGYFFFDLLLAPFLLIVLTFTDTAVFAIYSFKSNQIPFQTSKYKKLDKENVFLLQKITKQYLMKQDSKVQYKVFIKALQERMGLYSKITSYLSTFSCKEELFNSISDFKVLKRVVLRFTDGSRDIDLPLLYTILSEFVCKINIASSGYSCKDLEAKGQNRQDNNRRDFEEDLDIILSLVPTINPQDIQKALRIYKQDETTIQVQRHLAIRDYLENISSEQRSIKDMLQQLVDEKKTPVEKEPEDK